MNTVSEDYKMAINLAGPRPKTVDGHRTRPATRGARMGYDYGELKKSTI